MQKIVLAVSAIAICFAPLAAQAGGKNDSKSLVNVSPSVKVDDIKILNGSAILSGNNVLTGILNGNKTSVGEGLLGAGILNGNSYKVGKKN